MAFPTTLSNYVTGASSATLATAGHAADHNSLEAKVGVDGSAVATSLDYKISHLLVANITDITATTAEINKLAGLATTKVELGYVSGVTSAIQTQINTKSPSASPTFTGTVTMPVGLTGIAKLTTGVVSAVTAPSGTIVGTTDAQILSGKGITQRVITTTDLANSVIDCTITDTYQLSAVANATTFTVTGTPTDGQKLIIRYKDAGAPKGLTFTGFTALGVTIPTTTVTSKWGYVGAIFNSAANTWHILAASVEA